MNKIPRPVLGQQPPMPRMNLVPVNLVQGEEILLGQALVPTMSYEEEPSSSQWVKSQDPPRAPQDTILILM